MFEHKQRSRVHAFVPGSIASQIESSIKFGSVYLFKNFTLKDYKEDDKFRPLKKDIQIVFSNDIKIVNLDESDVFIEQCAFDFYDLGDLKQLSK